MWVNLRSWGEVLWTLGHVHHTSVLRREVLSCYVCVAQSAVWLQNFVVPPSAHILIRLVSGTGAVGDDASVSESELFTLRSS